MVWEVKKQRAECEVYWTDCNSETLQGSRAGELGVEMPLPKRVRAEHIHADDYYDITNYCIVSNSGPGVYFFPVVFHSSH